MSPTCRYCIEFESQRRIWAGIPPNARGTSCRRSPESCYGAHLASASEEAVVSEAQILGIPFARSPYPMWIYDRETHGFLDVNDAAVVGYGYSRAEFLKMKLLDIRPPEDIPE